MIQIKSNVKGFFKIEAVKPDGTRRVLADWFPNLILDQGLDRMGANSDYLNACQVGTGSTTPAAAQTGLTTYVAGTTSVESTTYFAASDAPYYGSITKRFRFAAGVAEGNISEVGIGWSSSGSTLFSRALILDEMSSPTTITVLADEVLDVTYELRQYAPTVDFSGTVDTYTVTLRASNVTDASSSAGWGNQLGLASAGLLNTGQAALAAYDGTLGVVTGAPSGTEASVSGLPHTVTNAAYSGGTYYRDITYFVDLNGLNVTGGIDCIKFGTTRGQYQASFSPAIDKDATKTMTLQFRIAWARA